MPHLTYEYSPGLQTDWKPLFAKIHPLMVALTGTPTIANCKSRAYCTEHYLAGDNPDTGFVHVDVVILEGKSKEDKQLIGTKLQDIIVEHLGGAAKGIQITIEVRDITKDFYFKHAG